MSDYEGRELVKALYYATPPERKFDRRLIEIEDKYLKAGQRIVIRHSHRMNCAYPKGDCTCGARPRVEVVGD